MKSDLIRQNRQMVETLSKGKIGYVYVPRDWNEFIKFEEEIYAQGAGKDGLIIMFGTMEEDSPQITY